MNTQQKRRTFLVNTVVLTPLFIAILFLPTSLAQSDGLDCESASVTAPIVADTWLDENSPFATKGTDAVLSVDAGSLNVDTGEASGRSRALLQFAMPDAVPQGCVVESAQLRLYSSEETPGTRVEAVRLDTAWSENAVSWSDPLDTIGAAARIWSRQGYMQWTVTGQVQSMLDDAVNHGFLIRDAAEGAETGGGGHGFYSREKGENPAELVILFAPPGSDDPGEPLSPTPAAVSCGQVLTQSTLVTNDLSDCLGDGLVIGAPRIIVDLGGHTIDGTGLGSGIRNEGYASVTVRNGTVQEFDYGVQLFPETTLNVVESLTLRFNQVAAVELFDVSATEIRGNTLDQNGGGIDLVSGTRDSVVADNTVTANGKAGLFVQDSSANRLENNTVERGGDLGIGFERASGNTLIGNTSSGNSDGGIELGAGSHGNRVEGNIVTESGDHGILISESDRNELIGNVSHLMSDSGITLNGANDGVVRGNDVRFNTGGLQVDGSSRNVFESNNASQTSGIGIELGGGSLENLLEGNTANANGAQGIYLADDATDPFGNPVPGNRLLANTASRNHADGIVVAKGGHTITANITRNNLDWGINAALVGSIDGGGNVATGNAKPEQCLGVVCSADDGGPPDPPDGDITPPETTIDTGPDFETTSTSATFTFSASEPASTFKCALDLGPFTACTSPAEYSGLVVEEHDFFVRATDPDGNTDLTPANYEWDVLPSDTTPPDPTFPDTTIDSRPDATTQSTSARFTFSASEPDSTFECALDPLDPLAPSFASCVSPVDYPDLAAGPHEFFVRATDPDGNTDTTPASYQWTVGTSGGDTTPPETTIVSGPAAETTSTSATFTFSASEPGSTFECSLDTAAFAACTSPRQYTGLAVGPHDFSVRAKDAAGNVDPTPEDYEWEVLSSGTTPPDTTPPNTTITGGPTQSSTTPSTSASFTFTSTEAGSTFQCSLDTAPFSACTSPQQYTELAFAAHTFRVRAIDAAGNTDGSPATRNWTIQADATPPPTSCSATTTTLMATADAWVDQSSPSSNKGDDSVLKVRSKGAGNFRALVRFALPSVPADCGVASATLRLYFDSAKTGRTLQALRLAGDWTENGVTWANQPATAGTAATVGSGTGYREWNVASRVQAMYDTGASHGFLIRDATENQDAEESFHSREKGQNLPQLVIRFGPPDTTPPDTTPPETTINSGPGATTTDTSATFTFSANEPGSTFECSLDTAAFAACTSPQQYIELAIGAHTFRVLATDPAGNVDTTPASHSWTVETPPETTIDSGPEEDTTSTSATFTFSADKPGSTFECALDLAPFAACTSPRQYTGLAIGLHEFFVRATDPDGNTDPTPADYEWGVLGPLETTITSGPSATTTSTSASFTFTSTEAGSTFECSLDTAAFADCTSPWPYTGMAVGAHQFRVRATDPADRVDATPASHSWTIQATPPPTGCSATPTTLTATADAWIDQKSPSSNKGTDSVLKVRSKGPADNLRALVRFALPASVPAGCVVQSATLRLYFDSAKTGRTLQALRLTGSWTENGVTWANQPVTAGTAATVGSGTGYREWNVVSQVQAMYVAGAIHGFLIRDATENQDAEESFHSREKGENLPQLVVRFGPAGG